MVILPDELQQALDMKQAGPLRVLDPRTNQAYLLVAEEKYEEIKALLEDRLAVKDLYPLMDTVAAKEGWDDPEMDIYNDLAQKTP